MRSSRLAVLLLLLAVTVGCGRGAQEVSERPPGTVGLEVGGRTLWAELAVTPEERQVGLMNREDMPENVGMLFLFSEERRGGFWMKNTLIPLSIAYMAAEGPDTFRILAILDMEPCEEDPCPIYDSGVLYRAALEVNEGWFARAGVDVGDLVRATEALPEVTA